MKKVTVEAVVQTEGLPDVVPTDSKVAPEDKKAEPEDKKAALEDVRNRFWCHDCGSDATLVCVDEHTVWNLRAIRASR